MKKVILFLTAILFCFSSSFASDTIKIGVPGSHSGDLASYGIPTKQAVELVVAKLNKQGGLLGKKIVTIAEDEMCKPELATNVAMKLAPEVDFIVGHICSGATKAALEHYKAANIITISPSATNTDLTFSGNYPNFFRTIAHDDAQASLQVDFAINTLKAKKIAVLHDKGDYGKGAATLAKKYIEKSGKAEIALFEGVTPGAVDYSAVVQKIKKADVDVVIWGGYHPEAAKIVNLMKRKRIKAKFIGADGVKDNTFIKTAGQYAEGVYASGPVDVSKRPSTIAAIKELKETFGVEPGAFFLQGYSAAVAITNAIKVANSTDYEKVINALRNNVVETPVGDISFDEKGDVIGAGFSMYEVKNGQFTEL